MAICFLSPLTIRTCSLRVSWDSAVSLHSFAPGPPSQPGRELPHAVPLQKGLTWWTRQLVRSTSTWALTSVCCSLAFWPWTFAFLLRSSVSTYGRGDGWTQWLLAAQSVQFWVHYSTPQGWVMQTYHLIWHKALFCTSNTQTFISFSILLLSNAQME